MAQAASTLRAAQLLVSPRRSTTPCSSASSSRRLDITPRPSSTAVALARLAGARIEALSVKEPFPYSAISEMQPIAAEEFFDAAGTPRSPARGRGRHRLRRGRRALRDDRVEALHPYEAIIEQATGQACDLIVMASHGRRGMAALLLGSETQKVLTTRTTAGAGSCAEAIGPVPGTSECLPARASRLTRASVHELDDATTIDIPAASHVSCAAVSFHGMRCCSCGIRSATAT